MSVPTRPMESQADVLRSMERALTASGLMQDIAIVVNSEGESVRCARCAISPAVPGIQLDRDGVCTECRRFERYKEKLDLYFSDLDQLRAQMEANKPFKRSDTDCLLLFSGGKDSTYVLHQLVDMGLKVMTYTFNNGFISRAAFENIEKTTRDLGVEHHTGSHAEMKSVFRESLQRHSSVCKGCFKALLDLSLEFADKEGINLIVTGLSRGQIMEERLKYFFDRNIFDPDVIDAKLAEGRRVYHQAERYTGLDGRAFGDGGIFDRVRLVDFFRYSDVEKKEIYEYLCNSSQGWDEPTDTGFCSSNCMINDVGVSVHQTERGYSNYEVPTSWEVRFGHLERDAAISELTGGFDVQRVNKMIRAVDYSVNRPDSGAVPVDIYCVLNEGVDLAQVKKSAMATKGHSDFIVNFIKTDLIERDSNGGITPHLGEKNHELQLPISKSPNESLSFTSTQNRLLSRGITDPANWELRVIPVVENLDRTAFHQALFQVLTRQYGLRLQPANTDGEPPVFAAVPAQLPLSWVDLSKRQLEDRSEMVTKLASVLHKKAISDSNKSLISFAVATPDAQEGSTLIVAASHAVMDDVSWCVLFSDLEQAYRAYELGIPQDLKFLPKLEDLEQPELPDWAYIPVKSAGREIGQASLKCKSDNLAAEFAEQLASKLSMSSVILESRYTPGTWCIGHFTGLPEDTKGNDESPDVVIVVQENVPQPGALFSSPGNGPDLVLAGGRSWAVIRVDAGTLSIRWTRDAQDSSDIQLHSAMKQLLAECQS